MAIIIPKYQSLFFKSLEDRTISIGNNLITNGKFNTNLFSWIADNYIWQTGSAAYNWTYGVYNGSVKQENINLLANKRYKVSFKYRATNKFDIVFSLKSMVSPAFDTMPEQVFRATQNGNWHIVEYYVNIKINTIQYLQIGSRGFPDDLGVNPLDGIEFDEVSIYEQKNITNCGDCDTVIMDSNKPIEFQIKGERPMGANLFPNGNYETNPFSPITSSSLVFNFNWGVDLIPYGSYFTLYIASKVYIFKFIENTNNSPYYTTVINGNVTIIDIHIAFDLSGTKISPASIAGRLYYVLQQIVDVNHGTTSTIDGTYPLPITIANLPSGSYLDDTAFSILTNISTLGASVPGINLQNGFYNSTTKQLNYLFLNDFVSGSMILKTNVVLETGKLYSFQFGYATIDNFIYRFEVRDNTDTDVFDIPDTSLITSFTGNNITGIFSIPADGTYTFVFTFNSDAHTSQLAFDNVTVNEFLEYAVTLQSKDCQGNLTTLPHTQIISENNALIQINNADFPTNTPFQIIINASQTDALGLQYFSENIQLIDLNNTHQCNVDSYVKLNWSDTCLFKDIDYKNLPFENEFYLRGFIQKQPLDKKERILFTQPDGSLKTIFNHSYAKVELRIGPYGKDVHSILERAIEHTVFKIDDVIYYMDEGSSYTVSAIGNGYFTARVELVEAGSEVIKSSCCC